MFVENVEGKRVIFRASPEEQIRNDRWIEVEKTKFILRSKIDLMENKIDQNYR